MEEITTDVLEVAREPKLEVEPEDMTEWLKSHEELEQVRSCFFLKEQKKWFPEIESIPDEYAVKTIEMTTMDSEYYINLRKQQQGLKDQP